MMLATPGTAFAIGFNYQVSIPCSCHVDLGELTSSDKETPSIVLSTGEEPNPHDLFLP